MRDRERNRADAMASLRQDVIALMATASGEFDDRIRELLELKKEIDERSQVSVTLGEVERMREEADSYAADVRGKADSFAGELKIAAAAMDEREQKLHEKEQALMKYEADLRREAADLNNARSNFTASADATTVALNEREVRLKVKEDKITQNMNEVDDMRRRLDERLKALALV